jgi:antitoxin component HigA of HigAB toxin-antitoxin module
MKVYKGITFAEDYNKSFADFKEEFGSTHVFKNIPSDQREAELKKAHKIATNGNSKTSAKTSEQNSAGQD